MIEVRLHRMKMGVTPVVVQCGNDIGAVAPGFEGDFPVR
jgi:hypothetical protein